MRSRILVASSLVVLALAGQAVAAPPVGPPIPRGIEIRVNTGTSVSQDNPRVAVFADGGFVVVWTAGSGVRARFFDPKGKPAGGERSLGIAGAADQAVADRDGSFLVAWSGKTAARPAKNVYVRRFHRDGTPRGKAFRANDLSSSDRYGAVAAIGPDGRFAVAWTAAVSDHTDAVGRIFKADGKPATGEIVLRRGSSAGPPFFDDDVRAYPTSLALAPDGTLSALFQTNSVDCLRSFLLRVPAGGRPGSVGFLGPPTCSTEPALGSALAMGVDGSLVAVWSDFVIQAQRFSPGGAPRGEPFAVSQYESSGLSEAGVALQAGGGFVVVWTEVYGRDGDGQGVFGRAFTANGAPRTGDFLISTTTAGDQFSPSIAAARQGPVVVVWNQEAGDSGRRDVFARVLSAETQ